MMGEGFKPVKNDFFNTVDPYNTTFEAGSNLLVEYVNTYGDLEITTTSGTMTTGANSQTVRAAGSSLKMTAQNTINVNGSVSNLTVPGALNGTVSYHSLNGSVAGNALSQANGIKVETPNGGIGTGGQDLRLNASNVVFTAQNNAFLELSGGTTVAGDSTVGAIDMTTSSLGNLIIDTVTVDLLTKTGLASAGVSGVLVETSIGGAINVNEGIVATNGSIQLTANGGISHGVNGDLTATGVGTIAVNANAGSLTMNAGTTYSTDGGLAALLASANIFLSEVDTSLGNITVNSTGGSIERVVGPASNLIGGNGYCSAQLGVGTLASPIQMTLTAFQGSVTSGDLYVFNTTGGLILNDWNVAGNSVTTSIGGADIQTGSGNLTVSRPVIAGAAGTIHLNANTGSIALNQAVRTNSGTITIIGNNAISHGMNGVVSVLTGTTGSVTETATNGSLTMNGAASIMTQGGFANLSAGGNVAVSEVNVAGGNILVSALNGSITKVAGPAVNLTGLNGYCRALSGVGTLANPLQTALANFQGTVTDTGDLYVVDTVGGLNLNDWNTVGNSVETHDGTVFVEAGVGNLTIARPVIAGGTGSITLDANTGSIALNQVVTANTGSIAIIGNTNVVHGSGGVVSISSGATGTVQETATIGSLTMDAASSIATLGGNITLGAGGNIAAAEVNAATGNIFVSSTGGSISRMIGPATNFSGADGSFIAQLGMGTAGNVIQTNLSRFQGNISGIGGLYVFNGSSGLELNAWNTLGNSVSTSSGNIDIQAGTGNLTITNPVLAGGTGTVHLEANAGSTLVNQTVSSNSGSIAIAADTDIIHSVNGMVTVTSGATGVITETATNGNLTMNGATLILTQGGSATLTAGGNVAVASVNTSGGDVLVESLGGFISRVTGPAVNLTGGNGYCQAQSGVGTALLPIRSDLTQLQSLVTGAGNLHLIDTASGLTLSAWHVLGNSIETNNGSIDIEVSAGTLAIANPVNAGGPGTINLRAPGGAITNISGATTPAIVVGTQGTLTAQSGIGSGTSSSNTAIGTDLATLIATVTGGGNIVVFEQSGLDLGAINAVGGTLDISAENLIRQIPGNPQLNVANARLTTRDTTIGTVDIFNTGHLILNASRAAGDLTVNVGTGTLTLGGNSEVGIDYAVTAGTYSENGFTVNVGGATATPPPLVGLNTVTASGTLTSFNLSNAPLATTGDITVNLRGGYYQAGTPQNSDAILLSSASNNITNSITVTTTDPNLSFVSQDYDLVNSHPIQLNVGQKLIINAAKGLNFTPGVSNPNSSPYDSSSLNGNNGSNVTLINVGPDNVFQDWISIRDPYNATFEAGSNLLVEYVNTYGDLEITTTAGTITTGANSQTVRAAGNRLALNSSSAININNSVSNLTVPGALNGIIRYKSDNDSILGSALSQASGIALETPNGAIGSLAQDLKLNTTDLVFMSQDNVMIELSGTATIAGDSTAASLDIATSGLGSLTVDTVTVGTLTSSGLMAGGGSGALVTTNSGDIIVNQAVSATDSPIQLIANGAVSHTSSGSLATTGSGAIIVNANAGALTMVPGTTYSTVNQNAQLSAFTNVDLAQVDVGTQDVFVNATTGQITRVGATVNLIGARGYCLAQSGVGTSGNPLQTTLTEFQGRVAGAGDLYIVDTGALNLNAWSAPGNSIQTASGNVDIQTASGNLAIIQPMQVGGMGNIHIIAANGNALINQAITANSGTISITGGTGVSHGSLGTVTVSSGTSGSVDISATVGDLMMNGASKIITQGGDVSLFAQNNLGLAEINTGTGGTVTATAQTGAITDTTAALLLPNFVTNEVVLQASSGIGSGTPGPTSTTDISVVTEFLTASTITGDIVISEAGKLNLKDISTQNGGSFLLEAGGLVSQVPGSSLQIDGNLSITTARALTLATVQLFNSVDTDLGLCIVAGNFTADVGGNIMLQGNQFVALNANYNPSGNFTPNTHQVFHGGLYFVNGVDPDLQGAMINATGGGPNFNLDLAVPLSTDPVITINLQGSVDSFNNPHVFDAITLTETGNTIMGTITIETVDPVYAGTVTNDYNLVQGTLPFNLNSGQTLIINAARGSTNPNVSGALGSPFGGSSLNSGLGSNINLPLANTVNGVVSIRDPNLCVFNAEGDLKFAHVNNYNTLTLTAPTGSITTGSSAQNIRSSGNVVSLSANGNIAIGAGVNALSTAGIPFGEIVYSVTNGSITGLGVSRGLGVSFSAPAGSINTQTQTSNCIFISQDQADITNNLVTGNFGGSAAAGPLSIQQTGSGNLVINATTVNGVTRTGLTASNQTINLTNTAAAIFQSAGSVNSGATGTVNLGAVSGITGTGPSATLQTIAQDVSALNSVSAEVRLENRLNGSNALASTVTLTNGTGSANTGRHLYYSQVGGSSVDFQAISTNGTATLLTVQGTANMRFLANVNLGSDIIAVANHNMEVGGVLLNLHGVGTFVLDQETLTSPGSGEFINAGMFNIASDNLAIYAASGPQPPTTAVVNPLNQVVLGSLAALATWDQSLPAGLDSKYHTSYFAGGSYHGPGFGNNYTPGNGVFGSQVIWYKFDVDHLPQNSSAARLPTSVPFNPLIGINAWEVDYFLYFWNPDYLRFGYASPSLMLIEEDFAEEPEVYQSIKSIIDQLRDSSK